MIMNTFVEDVEIERYFVERDVFAIVLELLLFVVGVIFDNLENKLNFFYTLDETFVESVISDCDVVFAFQPEEFTFFHQVFNSCFNVD